MPSERVQRQIDALLDEAEAAIREDDWQVVRQRANAALRFDPENADAQTYLEAAERDSSDAVSEAAPAPSAPAQELPTSFVGGRYEVERFLGEGGKRRVYSARDQLLDRDVSAAHQAWRRRNGSGRPEWHPFAQCYARGRWGGRWRAIRVTRAT